MKTFTNLAASLLLIGGVSGSAMAKDLFVSATGNDNNDGLSEATAKKTLTALDAIIEKNDIVHVSGILNIANEVPADFNPSAGYSGSDLNNIGGAFVSHDGGKKLGFNIASRGSNNWHGITFVGKDRDSDGFSGDGKWGHFIIRGKEKGGTTFKNLCFKDGIANLDGGTIFIKDEAIVNFENCSFSNNHPDWEKTYKLEGNAWKPNGTASERGGCIRTENNCVVNIDGCWFENNINRHGGAIMITGTSSGIVNTGGVTITNTSFVNNSAWCFEDPEQYLDNTQGAAIEVWTLNTDCYLKVDHCIFDGNKVWNNGGAIYIYDNILYGHYADITISNSSFFYNEAERGGALQIANFANGAMERKDYVTKTKNVNLVNCTFVNNSARTDGGAILYWGALTDPTQPDYPKDEFRMVNCTLIGNSTNGNAGHGAGYKEMNRSGDSEAYGKVGNANRYFYNNLIENNYAIESNELSDFCTPELFGHYLDNNYIGRIVITDGSSSVSDFLSVVNDGEGSTSNINNYSGDQLGGENIFYVANDPVATGLYDMSGFIVPGVALIDDSELKTAGNTKWLKLDDREIAIPNNTSKSVTRSGYDISKSDGLGFARHDGSCAVGASEYDVTTITPYLDGSIDLPYLSDQSSGISKINSDINKLNLTISGNIISAENAVISIYNLSGARIVFGHNSVNISSLVSGVYIVKAQSSKGSSVAKIAK